MVLAYPKATLLAVLAVVSLGLCVVILAFQRRILGRPSPAESEAARRWEEARRAQILHQLCQSVLLVAWLVF